MFSKKLFSFFVDEGQIRFIRVLIALLASQLGLFIVGSLLYLSFSKFSPFLNLFFEFLYTEVIKNGIFISTVFYIVVAYAMVVRYNKASLHSPAMKTSKKMVWFIVSFIAYSFYMLYDSGAFVFGKDVPIIKDHYYFYIIFLMAVLNIANSILITMVLSVDKINEKELAKISSGINKSFKFIYLYFISFTFFFISIKYMLVLHLSVNYYSILFFVIVMAISFIFTFFYQCAKVEGVLEKSVFNLDKEYKNLIKDNLDSVEVFRETGNINDLEFRRVDVAKSSIPHVRETIKEKGDFEQVILAQFSDDENILSAYFDKEGNLLAEDSRKKEKKS